MTSGKIQRTAAGLRDALFDELDALRSGEGDAQRAQSIVNLTKQIISVARAEIEFQKALNKDDRLCDDFMLGQLNLSTPRIIEHKND